MQRLFVLDIAGETVIHGPPYPAENCWVDVVHGFRPIGLHWREEGNRQQALGGGREIAALRSQ